MYTFVNYNGTLHTQHGITHHTEPKPQVRVVTYIEVLVEHVAASNKRVITPTTINYNVVGAYIPHHTHTYTQCL